ncbi:ribose-5-phosphate isomerase RpiA [Flavisolibacter sp. BT320]|nr:ribose-5-phosphate isomerase RpiA [Flavisolibacter longurius]
MESTDPKKTAAEKAVSYIDDNMVIGLGTGSTAYWAIQSIGKMVKQGLHIKAVCTSSATEKLARGVKIPIVTFSDIQQVDLAIDGADEIDPRKALIKGGGGALLREKIVAYNSQQFLVIADESKRVERLGRFPLPVEALPFGVERTLQHLQAICKSASIRIANGSPYITDNGNYIIDCPLETIPDPEAAQIAIKTIPGVLETGLFFSLRNCIVIIGYKDGSVELF